MHVLSSHDLADETYLEAADVPPAKACCCRNVLRRTSLCRCCNGPAGSDQLGNGFAESNPPMGSTVGDSGSHHWYVLLLLHPLFHAMFVINIVLLAMIVACAPTFRFLRKTSKSTGGGFYSNTYNTYNNNNSAWGETRRTVHSSIPLETYHSGRGLHSTAVYGGDVSSSVESLAPKNGVLVTTSHQVGLCSIVAIAPRFQSLTLKPSF